VSGLYGLPRPDRTADVELKGLSQEEIIKTTYEIFAAATEGKNEPATSEDIYKQAVAILKPFRNRIKGTIKDKGLENEYSRSMFFSALLNETDADTLVGHGFGLGYRLRDGKTLIIEGDVNNAYVGMRAKGGVVICNGRTRDIGMKASGGIFINNGITNDLGIGVSGGTYFNFGQVYEDFPDSSEYPKSGGNVGNSATGGTFIVRKGSVPNDLFFYSGDVDAMIKTRSNPYHIFEIQSRGIWGETKNIPKYERSDPLVRLIEAVEEASQKPDSKRVVELARQVDAEVKARVKRVA